MIEIFVIVALVVVIGVLLFFQARTEALNRVQTNKLINTIISKNVNELSQLELTDKTQISKVEVPPSQFVPESDLSDSEFSKLINQEINGTE